MLGERDDNNEDKSEDNKMESTIGELKQIDEFSEDDDDWDADSRGCLLFDLGPYESLMFVICIPTKSFFTSSSKVAESKLRAAYLAAAEAEKQRTL